MRRCPRLALLYLVLATACSSSGKGSPDLPDNTSVPDLLVDTTPDDLIPDRLAPDLATDDLPHDASDLPMLPDSTDTGPDSEPEDLVAEVEVTLPPEPVPPVPVARTAWGGYEPLLLAEGTGSFSTAVADGRAWLVDPDGHAFFSLGLQAVSTGSLEAPDLGYAPGKLAQWTRWTAELGGWSAISNARLAEHLAAMVEHGFNTVGGWSGGHGNLSGHGIAYSVSLGFAGGCQGALPDGPTIPKVSSGNMPDVFHPDFPAACLAYAQSKISEAQANDPWNLGYYSDNELRWWGKDYFIEAPDWTLADDIIDEAPESPAKEAFVTLMQERYAGDVSAFNQAYGLELPDFAALAEETSLPFDPDDEDQVADRMALVESYAEHYFQAVRTALKSVAPNHLYLCVRFASVAPEPVIEMAAKYCDVVSFNDYYILPDPITELALGGTPEERWARYGEIVTAADPPKPVLVTEWGIRADDSGLPNTFGAGFVVDSQLERADFYRFSADWFLNHGADDLAFVAGWHWFMYLDEPPTGRFDGEDGNYGVVTIRDEKYTFLWAAMAALNRWVDNVLVSASVPTILPPPATVTATHLGQGNVHLAWDEVPLAAEYEVTVLSHPAGPETRILETLMVAQTETTLATTHHGQGTFWFGVAARNEELLSLGPRVSQGLTTEPPATPPEAPAVLACETLATSRMHNEVPRPNDEEGQSYLRLVPSDDGLAIQVEFVPASLGYVMLSPSAEPALTATVDLAAPIPVTAESTVTLLLRPHHLVRTDQQVVAASDMVQLTLEAPDGTLLGQVHLGPLSLAPGDWTEVVLPVDSAGEATRLRLTVDLFEPLLPLESSVVVDVDNLAIQ